MIPNLRNFKKILFYFLFFTAHTVTTLQKYFRGRLTKATKVWWQHTDGPSMGQFWLLHERSPQKAYTCVLGERGEMVRESILQNSKGVVWWQQGHHENGHHDEVLLFFRLTVGLTSPQPCSRTARLQEGPARATGQKHRLHTLSGRHGLQDRGLLVSRLWNAVAVTGANDTRCWAGGGGVRPYQVSATLVLGFYIKRSRLGHTRLTWIFI